MTSLYSSVDSLATVVISSSSPKIFKATTRSCKISVSRSSINFFYYNLKANGKFISCNKKHSWKDCFIINSFLNERHNIVYKISYPHIMLSPSYTIHNIPITWSNHIRTSRNSWCCQKLKLLEQIKIEIKINNRYYNASHSLKSIPLGISINILRSMSGNFFSKTASSKYNLLSSLHNDSLSLAFRPFL
ncbi:hypothetical protein AGLY_003496 [Aphis glycines]|uniref:Uncharacterized protein n=1 Tax=Aphis glycines TaxID=307491 RepID=A0A6G0U168_APHGL|nr:hypothetical protein AGLY_003496 [Aphis glycines]